MFTSQRGLIRNPKSNLVTVKYFDCPYGYGLMVSADKVRKLDSKMENQFDKKPARRSKSVADLTRLLNTRNW